MRVTPVLCFFLFLFIALMYSSAYGSTVNTQKQPNNVMHGRISNRWGKMENQRRQPGLLHVVQHAGNGGRAVNGARPRNGRRNSANSLSIKSSSLFMAVFRHLIFGLLLVVCFY